MVGISVALLQGPYMGANSKEVAEEFYLAVVTFVLRRNVASDVSPCRQCDPQY